MSTHPYAPKLYDIRRTFFRSHRSILVRSHVTEEEAQAHCNDPETSSGTCTSTEGKQRTKHCGPWFDLYVAR